MFSFFKRKKSSSEQSPETGADTSVAGTQPDAGPAVLSDGPAEPVAPAAQQIGEAGKAVPEPAALPDAEQPPESDVRAEFASLPEVEAPAGFEPRGDEASAPKTLAPEPVPELISEPVPEPVPELAPEPVAQPVPVAPAASPVAPTAAVAAQEPAPAAESKTSWLSRLKTGLSRTGQSIGGLFVGVKVDEALFEELETALIMSDAGVEATEKLLTALRAKVRKERLDQASQVRAALRDILADHLAPLEKEFPLGKTVPLIVMIAGVNGAGKTTSIGKLAYTFQRQGATVLLAAGDTFRAAAREQLIAWGDRNNVTVIAQDGGDPAAIAFDAVNAGRARGAGVVMVDTAGRLPTQLHLMEELKKIKRVIGKADSAAPHEVLLVIDGNTGQNAISQIRAFDAAITLTGLVVTKLDGTAKGGTLAAVAAGSQGVRPIPVYWIGVGEGLEDLQPFVAREFASALVGE